MSALSVPFIDMVDSFLEHQRLFSTEKNEMAKKGNMSRVERLTALSLGNCCCTRFHPMVRHMDHLTAPSLAVCSAIRSLETAE